MIEKHCGDTGEFYKRFTLEQMLKLAELLPILKEDDNWQGSVFQKKYHYELDQENIEEFTNEERLDQLKEMHKSASDMPKTFQSHILLEILVYGRKLDRCYKEFFVEYLENPASNSCMYSDRQNFLPGYNDNWCRYYQNISGRENISSVQHDFHRNLLFYYLDSFYRAEVDISQWEKFFNKKDYKEMLSEIKFLNGEEIHHQDIPNLEDLGTKVMINILDSNTQHHKVDDKVQILCDLKNTPTVYIKIYEFNAENYYKSNLSNFNSEIDLDGLEPAFQRTEEFKETPQK